MSKSKRRVFPTSREDAKAAAKQLDSRLSRSPAYSLAFQDTDFLLRPELRPVRLQLELLKPELMLNELQYRIHRGDVRQRPHIAIRQSQGQSRGG